MGKAFGIGLPEEQKQHLCPFDLFDCAIACLTSLRVTLMKVAMNSGQSPPWAFLVREVAVFCAAECANQVLKRCQASGKGSHLDWER